MPFLIDGKQGKYDSIDKIIESMRSPVNTPITRRNLCSWGKKCWRVVWPDPVGGSFGRPLGEVTQVLAVIREE